jgi:hypothetical protein
MDPGADYSRQGDASRIEAAQPPRSEPPQAQPQAAGDADQGGRKAVVREALADRREREADEREEQMRALIGELRGLVTGVHRDALEAIESSLGLLSASAESFQRGEEAVKRAAARRHREEAATARAQDERQRADSPPARQGPAKRATEVRNRLSATIAAFAVAEDNAARIFDQLAASRPEHASAYQDKAQHARDAADRARELSRELAD